MSPSLCISWSVSEPECLGLRFECGLSSDNRFTETLEKGQLNEGLDVVPLVECLPSMHTNNPGFNLSHHIHRVWSCTTAIPACKSQLQVGGALGIRGQLGPHAKFQVSWGPHSETLSKINKQINEQDWACRGGSVVKNTYCFVRDKNLDPRIYSSQML